MMKQGTKSKKELGGALKWATPFLASAIVSMGANTASAATLTSTDFDTLDIGNLYAAEVTSSWTDVGSGADNGNLTAAVYLKDGIFTYALNLDPEFGSRISEFNTGFEVAGFTGTAGFSFSDVTAAGAPAASDAFSIDYEDDTTLDWNTNLDYLYGNNFWRNGESITFFFQSSLAPDSEGTYNFLSPVSQTSNYAPTAVPVPGAIYLLGYGMMGIGALQRKRRLNG